MEKRTKIVCTIGPASEKGSVLEALMKSGMNIARLNFSHGTHKNHKTLVKNIRASSKKTKKIIGIIADLQGPKIRLGELKEEIELKRNQRVILTTAHAIPSSRTNPALDAGEDAGSCFKISVTYKKLHKDVKKNHRILINDGLVEIKVLSVKGKNIFCKVVNGGAISSHKGMNFPDSSISLSSLTKKDEEDLRFAISMGADYVAISFVRSAKDIKRLIFLINKYSKSLKAHKPKIIAKIEKGEALENFLEILNLVDAIMVARGDLGVEIPTEDVPIKQKAITALCRQHAKPVIIATQMLDSMIRNPRPTRAEASDVANAVMDNVDAVMLSGETATGKYPKEAVKMMDKIIKETEASPYDDMEIIGGFKAGKMDGIGKSVAILIGESGIKDVVDLSKNELYRYVSKWRPEANIYVRTDEHNLYSNLFWSCIPFFSSEKLALAYLKNKKLVKKKFILLSGEDKVEIID